MAEEDITEAKAAAYGIIIFYMVFALAGMVFRVVDIWWGILAILIMTTFAHGIAPGYPEVVMLYNYALFGLLIVVGLLSVASVAWVSSILMLVTIIGPLLVVAVPMGHILYLVGQGSKKEAPRAPPITGKVAPGEKEPVKGKPGKPEKIIKVRPTPQKKVKGRVGHSFALVCGYETLNAKRAVTLLLLRTALTWIIGSVVIIILTKVLKVW